MDSGDRKEMSRLVLAVLLVVSLTMSTMPASAASISQAQESDCLDQSHCGRSCTIAMHHGDQLCRDLSRLQRRMHLRYPERHRVRRIGQRNRRRSHHAGQLRCLAGGRVFAVLRQPRGNQHQGWFGQDSRCYGCAMQIDSIGRHPEHWRGIRPGPCNPRFKWHRFSGGKHREYRCGEAEAGGRNSTESLGLTQV